MAHLHTGYEPPIEYVGLVLCRDVYGCLPSQLDAEPADTILEHLYMLGVEGEYRKYLDRKR